MKLKIKQLVDIQIGYQLRAKAKPSVSDSEDTHQLIQIKDLDPEAQFIDDVFSSGGMMPYVWYDNLDGIAPTGKTRRYTVNDGDVLFLSRGPRLIAIPIITPPADTMAAHSFYILRLKDDSILPQYLAWYINQPPIQTILDRQTHGSNVKMIPKSLFEELEIDIPPLPTQQTIIELEKLRQQEEHTMNRLANARKRLISSLALQATQTQTTRNTGE